jgi:hypothetical protein
LILLSYQVRGGLSRPGAVFPLATSHSGGPAESYFGYLPPVLISITRFADPEPVRSAEAPRSPVPAALRYQGVENSPSAGGLCRRAASQARRIAYIAANYDRPQLSAAEPNVDTAGAELGTAGTELAAAARRTRAARFGGQGG